MLGAEWTMEQPKTIRLKTEKPVSLKDLDLERHLADPVLRQSYVTPMFDLIAPRYDDFTRTFSFGMDRGWKRSLVEMARAFGARRHQLYTKVLVLSALPEILAGVRLGAIRGVKGVVIGQLLVAIIGVGELFELYSQHFLMEEFWALVLVVFLFAFAVSETIAALERRVEYYAGSR